jgi:peptidoglycan hydrolase-like protein with peptidoglycan-binding domain
MKKYLIASIVALTVALVASSVSAAFTRNLTVGSTGADVAELQTWLISKGYSIPSISSGAATPGYFGAQTKSAVMAYQSQHGLPSTGFFGPLTRASVEAMMGGSTGGNCPAGFNCTPTGNTVNCPVGFTCTPVGGGQPVQGANLAGTDGSISDVELLSQYSDEEVGEGQNDVKVLGFEVEASTDGDIALKSIKLVFDPSGNAAADSDHLDDYIEGVTVWMGDKEIGSADVSDFTETSSDTFTKTIALSGNVIIRADDKERFYITVDGANSFDSSDIDSDAWTIDVESIRFEDGSGVVSTETVTMTAQQIDFVSFSTSADTELRISTDSSSPEANIVMVDDENVTEDVLLLVGKLRLDGTSDVTIDELPITFTVAGTATGLASTTASVKLVIDGEEFSETIGSSYNSVTASVVFDNLDFVLAAEDEVVFKVYADVESVDGVLTEGDAILASLTASNRNGIDAENEEGDQLTSSERSGTAIGEGQEFRTEGIGLTLVSTSADATVGQSATDDVGQFTIRYKVTAFGNSVYVSSLTSSTGLTYAVDKGGTATSSVTIGATLVNSTDDDLTSVGNYLIEEGDSETFELSVTVPITSASGSGQYRTALTGVKWDTDDDATPDQTYNSDLDAFKTSYKLLN